MIVDDDPSFLEGAQTFLSSQGYDVDMARSPDEAVEMLKESGESKYQLVIVDFNFEGLSKTQGDEFVLKNQGLFGKAKKVIITGGEWLSSRRDELMSAGVVFVEKSHRLPKVLQSITQEENQRWVNAVKLTVSEELLPRIEKLTGQQVSLTLVDANASPLATNVLLNRLKQALIKLLMARTEFDEPIIYYGQKVYSAKQLANEVENDTEVGFALMGMLLSEFEGSLSVD